jgi:hypothetical protein
MNNKLKELEKKKILQEYEFIKTDLEYKRAVLDENQSQFLDEAYSLVGDERISQEESNESAQKLRTDTGKTNWDLYEKSVYDNAKKLYREISKRTHPDRDPEGIYTEVFAQAAIAYEECRILEIYSICEKLGISYNIEEADILRMKEEISKKKEEIKTIENSFAYMWSVYENEKSRELIIRQFVRATRGKL